jgi:hypothetical protein
VLRHRRRRHLEHGCQVTHAQLAGVLEQRQDPESRFTGQQREVLGGPSHALAVVLQHLPEGSKLVRRPIRRHTVDSHNAHRTLR